MKGFEFIFLCTKDPILSAVNLVMAQQWVRQESFKFYPSDKSFLN